MILAALLQDIAAAMLENLFIMNIHFIIVKPIQFPIYKYQNGQLNPLESILDGETLITDCNFICSNRL